MALAKRRFERPKRVQITGNQTFAANGEFRVAVDKLQGLGGVKGVPTYIHWIKLVVTLIVADSSGAPATIEEGRVFDVLDRIEITRKSGRPMVNLRQNAGSTLYHVRHAFEGRKPVGPNGAHADVTGPTGGNGTIYLEYLIPFVFDHFGDAGEGYSDFRVPLNFFRNGEMEFVCRWSAADFLHATKAVVQTTTSVKAYAYCAQSLKAPRIPAGYELYDFTTSDLEREIPVERRTIGYLGLAPNNGASTSLTQDTLTTGEVATVDLQLDEEQIYATLPGADLPRFWNELVRPERVADMLAPLETTPSDMGIPLLYPTRGQWGNKLTHLHYAESKPLIKLTGSITNPRYVILAFVPNVGSHVTALAQDLVPENTRATIVSDTGKGKAIEGGPMAGDRLPKIVYAEPLAA